MATVPLTRAEWVDARLREAILTGELAPGERLRAEHLAEAWGVSATPLREAFQRLAGEGLVTLEPQRGARVAPIDARDAAELYELRLALDPLALRSSMATADETYRSEVAAAHTALGRRHRSVAGFLDAHRTFHLAVLARCTNRRLLQQVRQLHDHTQRYHVTSTGPRRPGRPEAEHAELCAAVLDGDVDTAVAVLTAHLAASLTALTDLAG